VNKAVPTQAASPGLAPTKPLREIADLPGPRGWPVLGNLFQVRRPTIHQSVERWSVQHGPYFRFSLGGRHLLGVADHEALHALLRDRPEGFRRTRLLESLGVEMGLKPGVFGANGDAWKRQRRMVMAGFDPAHIKAYFPSLLKVTQRLRGRWQKAARDGAAIDLQADLMRFTVDAIAGLAFGTDINTLESDADVIQRHLDKIFPAFFKRLFSFFPTWRYWRSAADRELARSIEAVNVQIDTFIRQARARLQADPARREHPPNLLEAMIISADAGDAAVVSDAEVAGNVLTMLLAGEDTTANTLAWMIHLLQRNPEALQRAQAEVRSLAPNAAAFTPEQMSSLDYLEACAHETMRLKPVAPFQVTEALRDTTIADIRVPAGTMVWCVMRGDTMDERYFPNAKAFEPQRWLASGAPSDAANSAKRVSIPFGAGPRVCPGRYLALLEIKMAAAMLLAHFDIESVTTHSGAEAAELMAFTMTPVGLQMRLRERA
jgi:cytochrome P450